jgi:hypothetical protein
MAVHNARVNVPVRIDAEVRRRGLVSEAIVLSCSAGSSETLAAPAIAESGFASDSCISACIDTGGGAAQT